MSNHTLHTTIARVCTCKHSPNTGVGLVAFIEAFHDGSLVGEAGCNKSEIDDPTVQPQHKHIGPGGWNTSQFGAADARAL